MCTLPPVCPLPPPALTPLPGAKPLSLLFTTPTERACRVNLTQWYLWLVLSSVVKSGFSSAGSDGHAHLRADFASADSDVQDHSNTPCLVLTVVCTLIKTNYTAVWNACSGVHAV